MNVYYPAFRRGKSHAMRMALDHAVQAGLKVAICSTGPDGEPHVCTVESIARARQKRNIVAPCDGNPSHRDPPDSA